METSPPDVAKRLWNIVRIVFILLRKGISKRKLMMDLHLMMKRGKIAGKALGNLMFHRNYSSLSCRSSDTHLSFFAPQEYEFSCSNTPAHPFPFHVAKRKNRHLAHFTRHHHQTHHHSNDYVSPSTVLEMHNSDFPEASPVALSGFGKSPMVRQLRITDSPFPIRDADEGSSHVDNDAEEFIKMFYEQLRLQKRMAASEARYQEMLARSIS
eukprot:TRINITY_DN2235_c0_g1_i2.p1 TRINITY_DN2235_c0_g1~~TRINITY_DN2235_c0_g1_i2.p1  ORF type:complete len:243 (-),score=4.60 TRINITY_DN2235_c0_g1_i2:218-850(-)